MNPSSDSSCIGQDGYLTTWFGWRGVFLFNVPVMALSVVVSYFFVKNKKSKYKINLDIVGAILITLFLISAMLIITQRSWIYVLLSVALVFVFIDYEKRVKSPIIPVAVLKLSSFKVACALRFLTVMPFYIMLMLASLFIQKNFHFSAIDTGLLMLAMTLAVAVSSPLAGRLIDKSSAGTAILAAALTYISAFVLLIIMLSHPSILLFLLVLMLVGLAFALASPASLMIGLRDVSDSDKGAASGVFYMSSVVSGLIGVTLASATVQYWHVNSSLSITAMTFISVFCIILNGAAIVLNYFFRCRILNLCKKRENLAS